MPKRRDGDLDRRLERVIDQIRGGDVDAYIDVVRLLEHRARSWVTARCPPGSDPDEIAHEAFITAYDQLDRYQAGTSFRAWFFAILRNKLLSAYGRARDRNRAKHRYALHAIAQEQERRLAEERAPNDDEEALATLRSCLAGLAPGARELVQLRYDRAEDLASIARHTGRSIGALKKAFFKIRRQLLECLQRHGITELDS